MTIATPTPGQRLGILYGMIHQTHNLANQQEITMSPLNSEKAVLYPLGLQPRLFLEAQNNRHCAALASRDPLRHRGSVGLCSDFSGLP
jgi:hypothetical protein